MNIYEKLSAITNEIEKVGKDLTVSYGKTSGYKAVSEGSILKVVKPLEEKYGVYSYPFSRRVIETQVLVNTKEYNGEIKETKQLFMRIETGYRFVNTESPEEYVDMVSYGDGVDAQDKATGKAMTYSDKYALMKAYKIETGDDPDADHSGELKDAKVVKGMTGLATEKQIDLIEALLPEERITSMLNHYKISVIEELTKEQASDVISKVKK